MAVAELLKTKRTELETLKNNVITLRAQLEAAEKAGQNTGEDRTKLNTTVDAGTKLREEVDRLVAEEALTAEVKVDDAVSRSMARNGGIWVPTRKTPGEIVVGSEQLKRVDKTQPKPIMDPVKIGGIPDYRTIQALRQLKAMYESTDATGGALTPPDYLLEPVIRAQQRPLRIAQLVMRSRTTLDLVQYPIYDSRTNNAAVKAEFTAGNFGIVTASDMGFLVGSANVQTLVAFVAASVQILQDAPRLTDLIDNELTYEIELLLENQILTGDGTGNNFTGINVAANTQARVHQVSGRNFASDDTILDTIRKAITDLSLEFYYADGIVLHPTQGENMELAKDDIGQYLKMYDPVSAKVWRVPVVETPAQTAGTATVANFQMGATLWDRMDSQILTGQPNDYFLRLAWAVLGYLRAAFAVTRPKAIEVVTGL